MMPIRPTSPEVLASKVAVTPRSPPANSWNSASALAALAVGPMANSELFKGWMKKKHWNRKTNNKRKKTVKRTNPKKWFQINNQVNLINIYKPKNTQQQQKNATRLITTSHHHVSPRSLMILGSDWMVITAWATLKKAEQYKARSVRVFLRRSTWLRGKMVGTTVNIV